METFFALLFLEEYVKRRFGGDEKQRLEFRRAFRRIMYLAKRVAALVREIVVELLVFVFGDLGRIAYPYCLLGVKGFVLGDVGTVFLRCDGHFYGVLDKVGILFHDLFYFPLFEIGLHVRLEVDDYFRTLSAF